MPSADVAARLVSEAALAHPSVTVDACLASLIPTFLSNRRREIAAMRAAALAGDTREVCRLAHRMKGVGGTYGFDYVTLIAAEVERAAAAGTLAAMTDGLAALEQYLDRVRIEIDPS